MLEEYNCYIADAIRVGDPEDHVVLPILLNEMLGYKVK